MLGFVKVSGGWETIKREQSPRGPVIHLIDLSEKFTDTARGERILSDACYLMTLFAHAAKNILCLQ